MSIGHWVLTYIAIGWWLTREDFWAIQAAAKEELPLGIAIGLHILLWPLLGLIKGRS